MKQSSGPITPIEPNKPNKPIKVCLIIPTLDQGGAEKQLAMLACGLDRDVFETSVVVLTRSGPLEEQLRAAGGPRYLWSSARNGRSTPGKGLGN